MANFSPTSFSQFPKVFGVVYALKGDALLDKKISLLVEEGKEFAALRAALGPYNRIHRCLALLLYLSNSFLHWVPSLPLTLHIFEALGPSRSWFRYLLDSGDRDTLRTAKSILQKKKLLHQTTVDIGCGLGHLPIQFPQRRNHQWICIDKNFFSLFLAQLYHHRKDILYVCADVEVERLFSPTSVDTVVCLDCFAWIYQKDVFVSQAAGILKKNGSLLMVNVHEEQSKTFSWGYGITRQQLKKLFLRYFKTIEWHDHRTPEKSQRSKAQELDSLGFSCLALHKI